LDLRKKKERKNMNNNKIKVGYYKLRSTAVEPKYSTKNSACFDIYTALEDPNSGIELYPGDIKLIPTGLVFDIPDNYSIRLHLRSSIGLNTKLRLANQEGVIDSDYTKETCIMLENTSKTNVEIILNNQRLVQGEIVPLYQATFEETNELIEQKTDRIGGFGSTGK